MVLNENIIFSVEHGPQGGDEINLILEGKNYGWPIISYGTKYNNGKSYKKYDDKIQIDQKSLNVGINIENYINNMKSNNEHFKSNIELCSAFFYKYTEYHLKYLSSLELELKNLYKNTSSEINFNIINLVF